MKKIRVALLCTLCWLLLFTTTALAAEPKLTLYVPFDGSINATIAGGNAQGKYGLSTPPQFKTGIDGQGLVNGESKQHVVFDAAGNISDTQWTIAFWMKGLPGAHWNSGNSLQTFWELNGEDGFMWFYKFSSRGQPWLFSRQGDGDRKWFLAPIAPEEQWHYWAVSWRKGGGAYLYLDGQLTGQSSCEPPAHIKTISIGQRENPSVQNKIIDEFKIYDTALGSGEIARRYWQEGNITFNPEITVTPTEQKITIDGNIGNEEWRNTAGFTGFVDEETNQIDQPQTRGRITYDDQYLYLAMHSDTPKEVKDYPDTTILHGFVKKDALHPDGNVTGDDSFLFQLMPKFPGNLYSVAANGINTLYDAITPTGEKEDISWQSGAQVKSSISMDGWSLEAAIPLKSLGVNNLTAGTSWRINVKRIWKMLRQRTDVWAAGKSNFGTVHFSSSPSAVVNLQKFIMTADGQIETELSLYNPGGKPQELLVTLKAGDENIGQQQLTLNPNESKSAQLTALPKNANGKLIEIAVQSEGKVLFRQAAPLILEQVGQLNFWEYPSQGQIRLGWTIQGDNDPASLKLDAQIKDTAGKILQNTQVTPLPAQKGSTLMDIKSLAPGEYTIEAQVKEGDIVVQQQTFPYHKKPLPSWLGNTLGLSDTPPPPWTDVKVNKPNDTLSVWGRDYEYAGHLFPSQIINQGKPMLAAPMQLMVQSTNGKVLFSGSTKASSNQWTKVTATRADSLRDQTLGNVNVQADSYVEFDGMSWVNLTVSPVEQKMALDKLTIEIPLKKEWAKLLKPADDYLLDETGALPKAGWKGKASSMPWIGNANGGIQFFQESTATWVGSKSVEVIPDGDVKVLLRVHLIDAPFELNKPLHFAFGWMASPVKAAPKDHRNWRLMSPNMDDTVIKPYVQKASALNPDIQWYLPWWNGWWWLTPDYYTSPNTKATASGLVPVPGDNKLKNAVRDYAGAKFYGAPYGRLTEVGTANEWFEQFGDEWVPNTNKFTVDSASPAWSQITSVTQASRSLRDFYAWGYNRLLNEGEAHALYFDVSRPIDDTNIYHGSGTEMPDGSIEPSFNILGTRQVMKRIYTLMKAKHPNGKIFYHMSGKIRLPIDSFCDAMVDGENYAGKLDRKNNRGYEKVLSVDQFRTEYSAQNNFGPASVFLPQFGRTKSIKPEEWKTLGYGHADYVMGLVLLHNSNIWWIHMPQNYLANVYSALDATGLNATWDFTPYWEQKYFSLPEGVYGSVYQSPDDKKVLLVIMNTSGQDQQFTLPLTLGKSTFKTAKAVYPDQVLNVTKNTLNTGTVKNNDFIAVVLNNGSDSFE